MRARGWPLAAPSRSARTTPDRARPRAGRSRCLRAQDHCSAPIAPVATCINFGDRNAAARVGRRARTLLTVDRATAGAAAGHEHEHRCACRQHQRETTSSAPSASRSLFRPAPYSHCLPAHFANGTQGAETNSASSMSAVEDEVPPLGWALGSIALGTQQLTRSFPLSGHAEPFAEISTSPLMAAGDIVSRSVPLPRSGTLAMFAGCTETTPSAVGPLDSDNVTTSAPTSADRNRPFTLITPCPSATSNQKSSNDVLPMEARNCAG